MLLSFVVLVTSSSHLAFWFCNFIIAVLLIDISNNKPTNLDGVDESECELEENSSIFNLNSPCSDRGDISVNQVELHSSSYQQKEAIVNQVELHSSSYQQKEAIVIKEEEEEEEDIELRRRIEEFIEKMNRAWMSEKLRTEQTFSVKF